MITTALRTTLRAAFTAMTAARVAHLGLGPLNRQGRLFKILEMLAYMHLAFLALVKRKFSYVAIGLAVIHPISVDGSEMTLLHRFLCLLVLGKKGTNLPPVVYTDVLVRAFLTNGLWKRHLLEKEAVKYMGDTWCIIRPFNSDSWALATPVVFVSNPDVVREVLQDKESYPTRGHTGFSSLTKNGLLGLPTNETWTTHRRVVSKFLSDGYLKKFSEDIQGQCDVLLDKWEDAQKKSKVVNAYYDMSMLTLDIIMRVGTGTTGPDANNQSLDEKDNDLAHGLDYALQEIVMRTLNPLHEYIPSPNQWYMKELMNKMFQVFERVFQEAKDKIETAEANGVEIAPTMLSAMVKAKNPDGTPALNEEELRDELTTVRGAGHETTSNTLCWCLISLMRNPEKLAKLREEILEVTAGDNNRSLSYEQAKKLKYGHQVIYESLRMFPTVPSFPREAMKATKIKHYDIPKHALVFVSQTPMNYNAELWPEPDKFIPERFDELPELLMSKPVGIPGGELYGFVPFGAGARTCIGQRLAMLEALQILGSVVKNFDWKLRNPQDDATLTGYADVTLGPKHGLFLDVMKILN